jgi:hypothetical protein
VGHRHQFRLKDHTGKAKFISGAAKDMPFGKSTRDIASHDFAMLGAGWEWTDEEVAQARCMASASSRMMPWTPRTMLSASFTTSAWWARRKRAGRA